jgi:hypothetical protein
MKIDRKALREKVRTVVRVVQEHTSYSSLFNAPMRIHIDEELDRGNIWAWCSVGIEVHYAGITEVAWLSECSYASEASFLSDSDQVEGLTADAIEELAQRLEALVNTHGIWEHDQGLCLWCVAPP